jgi:hypothetical protein
MSYTCFEPKGSSLGRRLYIQVWYSVLYMHQYKQVLLEERVYFGYIHSYLPQQQRMEYISTYQFFFSQVYFGR